MNTSVRFLLLVSLFIAFVVQADDLEKMRARKGIVVTKEQQKNIQSQQKNNSVLDEVSERILQKKIEEANNKKKEELAWLQEKEIADSPRGVLLDVLDDIYNGDFYSFDLYGISKYLDQDGKVPLENARMLVNHIAFSVMKQYSPSVLNRVYQAYFNEKFIDYTDDPQVFEVLVDVDSTKYGNGFLIKWPQQIRKDTFVHQSLKLIYVVFEMGMLLEYEANKDNLDTDLEKEKAELQLLIEISIMKYMFVHLLRNFVDSYKSLTNEVRLSEFKNETTFAEIRLNEFVKEFFDDPEFFIRDIVYSLSNKTLYKSSFMNSVLPTQEDIDSILPTFSSSLYKYQNIAVDADDLAQSILADYWWAKVLDESQSNIFSRKQAIEALRKNAILVGDHFTAKAFKELNDYLRSSPACIVELTQQ